MSTGESDYFAWVKTGHFSIGVAVFVLLFSVPGLVIALGRHATGAAVISGVFVVISLLNLLTGIRQLRSHRAGRRT